jgi:hypothetical protein
VENNQIYSLSGKATSVTGLKKSILELLIDAGLHPRTCKEIGPRPLLSSHSKPNLLKSSRLHFSGCCCFSTGAAAFQRMLLLFSGCCCFSAGAAAFQRVLLLFSGCCCFSAGAAAFQRVLLLFSWFHCHAAGAAAFQRVLLLFSRFPLPKQQVPTAQAAGAAAFAASPQNNPISALPSPQILHILEVHSQRKLPSLFTIFLFLQEMSRCSPTL